MVGLGILSLNQFAENVSKAEALSAEIASVHNGLRRIASPSDRQEVVADKGDVCRKK